MESQEPRHHVWYVPHARYHNWSVVTGTNFTYCTSAIRLHQKSHITLSTVYRWMSEARKRGPGCNHVGRRNYSEFLLYPVNIKALTGISSFLEYGVMGHGNPLPRVSTDVLQPGVYGAFLPGKYESVSWSAHTLHLIGLCQICAAATSRCPPKRQALCWIS